MNTTLVDQKDKVFITDIPRMKWGENRDNSFINAARLTLNALGENLSYDFLMGISGAAFRFHFHPDFCASSADATVGFDLSKVLFSSLGYPCRLHRIDDKSFSDIRDLFHKIKIQIDKGVPVIAINLKVCPEWGIITGYLKNRPGILCRTYFDESDDYSLAEHAPWLSFFVGDRQEGTDRAGLFRKSLDLAVQLFATPRFGEYYSGIEAFKRWIEKLEDSLGDLHHKPFNKGSESLTLFISLLDSRRAACEYLSRYSAELKLNNGSQILDLYREEVSILAETQTDVLPGFNAKPEDWSADILGEQVQCLRSILKNEQEILELLQNERND